MDTIHEHCRIPRWYPRLSVYSLPTVFVYLQDMEIQALENSDAKSSVAKGVIERLDTAMNKFPFTRFVSVDLAAPTDTERFAQKNGAVRSARSAWNILCSSAKVRNSAKRGEVSAICVRPFRRMDPAREFRLFVKDGKLKAMSQYWLTRHFPQLLKKQEFYWQLGQKFVDRNFWCFPETDLAIDVYFTSSDEPIVNDLNPFCSPTDPLMLNSWNQDWRITHGLKIVPPPHQLSGDVTVSF